MQCKNSKALFQHTAARRRLPNFFLCLSCRKSFNTQPRGGGCLPLSKKNTILSVFQHTAARRRLLTTQKPSKIIFQFQHTAARRRLLSTHSRAEAAAGSFNTQPRGGGCSLHKKVRKISELNTVFR